MLPRHPTADSTDAQKIAEFKDNNVQINRLMVRQLNAQSLERESQETSTIRRSYFLPAPFHATPHQTITRPFTHNEESNGAPVSQASAHRPITSDTCSETGLQPPTHSTHPHSATPPLPLIAPTHHHPSRSHPPRYFTTTHHHHHPTTHHTRHNTADTSTPASSYHATLTFSRSRAQALAANFPLPYAM